MEPTYPMTVYVEVVAYGGELGRRIDQQLEALVVEDGTDISDDRLADHTDLARELLVARDRGEPRGVHAVGQNRRSEEHTSELQSRGHLVCRLLLEKQKTPVS